MLTALLLGIALFLLAVWFHLAALRVARRVSLASTGSHSARQLAVFLIILGSHLTVAAFFAVGFWFGYASGLGGFAQEPNMGVMDYFYFSLINVTTLGLGDIYPTGHLRVIAGIESLTGFLLISCSAQLVFKTMKKQEEE